MMPAPVITKIERQKKARHRVSIYLDGVFAFGVNDEAVYRFGLRKGMALDDGLRAEIELADRRAQARRIAERFLAARPRSIKEIRDRLRRDEVPDAVIDEIVETLLRVRLLDDRAFAEMFVRDRMKLRPRARSVLRAELRKRGIDDETVDAVLDQEIGEIDEARAAESLAADYIRRHPGLGREVLRRRLAGFLQRKGYSVPVVYRVLSGIGGAAPPCAAPPCAAPPEEEF